MLLIFDKKYKFKKGSASLWSEMRSQPSYYHLYLVIKIHVNI